MPDIEPDQYQVTPDDFYDVTDLSNKFMEVLRTENPELATALGSCWVVMRHLLVKGAISRKDFVQYVVNFRTNGEW